MDVMRNNHRRHPAGERVSDMKTLAQVSVSIHHGDNTFSVYGLQVNVDQGTDWHSAAQGSWSLDKLPAFEAFLSSRGFRRMSDSDGFYWWQLETDDGALPAGIATDDETRR